MAAVKVTVSSVGVVCTAMVALSDARDCMDANAGADADADADPDGNSDSSDSELKLQSESCTGSSRDRRLPFAMRSSSTRCWEKERVTL